MNVTEAVTTRRSIRQFTSQPVEIEKLQRVLQKAQLSPSGGNTQPWNAVLVTGDELARITAAIKAKAQTAPMGENHEYAIYPKDLAGRYEDQRRGVGKAMFAALGLGREDARGADRTNGEELGQFWRAGAAVHLHHQIYGPAAMERYRYVAANRDVVAARRGAGQLRAGNMGDVRHVYARAASH